MSRWPLSAGIQGGAWHWPEGPQVYLLLDGVRVEQLAKRLYEWSAEYPLEADLLYAGTPLAEVSDVSPWLVALPEIDHPVLQAFLTQGLDDEWGYLIESQASLVSLGHHLRKLLHVRHPAGVPMWLRLADPAVIAALLPDQSDPAMVPWGPMECLIRPDAIEGHWVISGPARRTDEDIALPPEGYLMNDVQLGRLHACDQRRDIRRLLTFVDTYCAALPLPVERADRYVWLEALTTTAREHGFTTLRQWGLLCTLLRQTNSDGWETLRQQAPAVYTCLIDTKEASPPKRLKAAFAILSNHSETT